MKHRKSVLFAALALVVITVAAFVYLRPQPLGTLLQADTVEDHFSALSVVVRSGEPDDRRDLSAPLGSEAAQQLTALLAETDARRALRLPTRAETRITNDCDAYLSLYFTADGHSYDLYIARGETVLYDADRLSICYRLADDSDFYAAFEEIIASFGAA